MEPTERATAWPRSRRAGSAAALHAADLDHSQRAVVELVPAGPALVLGSSQRPDEVDVATASARGVEVVQRRSGGGAVWVDRSDPWWFDVVVPSHDPRYVDDVGAAFGPVGLAIRAALESIGVTGAVVAPNAPVVGRWARRVCFAGLGPGEVTVDGAKLVGLSQRRTRLGARFQCAIYQRWDPAPLRDLLVAPPPQPVLERAAIGLDDLLGGRAAERRERFLEALTAVLDDPAAP